MPATIIKIRQSDNTRQPPVDALSKGELAYSFKSIEFNNGNLDFQTSGKILWLGTESNGDVVATPIGGEYFTLLLDHTPGIVTSNSALLVDSNKKLNELFIDNISIDANTISSTNTNGNIILNPNGNGFIDVSNTRIINLADPLNNSDAATKKYVDDSFSSGIGGLGDIELDTNLSDAQFLIYDGLNDVWRNQDISGDITIDNTGVATISNSGVDADTYGSATEIPVITIDSAGRITAATTASVATSLSLSADTGTGEIDLLTDSLKISGGKGIETKVDNDEIIIDLDSVDADQIVDFSDSINTVLSAGTGVTFDYTSGANITGNLEISIGQPVGTTDDVEFNKVIIGDRILGPGRLVIDPAPYFEDGVTDGSGGEVVIKGDLTVTGTTTTVNSTEVTIADKNILLSSGSANSAASDEAGITIDLGSDGTASLKYLDDGEKFSFDRTLEINGSLELSDGISSYENTTPDELDILVGDGNADKLILGSLNSTQFERDTNSNEVSIIEIDGGTF